MLTDEEQRIIRETTASLEKSDQAMLLALTSMIVALVDELDASAPGLRDGWSKRLFSLAAHIEDDAAQEILERAAKFAETPEHTRYPLTVIQGGKTDT